MRRIRAKGKQERNSPPHKRQRTGGGTLDFVPAPVDQGGRVVGTFLYIRKALRDMFEPTCHLLLVRCGPIKDMKRQQLTFADLAPDMASISSEAVRELGPLSSITSLTQQNLWIALGIGENDEEEDDDTTLPFPFLMGRVLMKAEQRVNVCQRLEALVLNETASWSERFTYFVWCMTWYYLGAPIPRGDYLAPAFIALRLAGADASKIMYDKKSAGALTVYGQFTFQARALFHYWFERPRPSRNHERDMFQALTDYELRNHKALLFVLE